MNLPRLRSRGGSGCYFQKLVSSRSSLSFSISTFNFSFLVADGFVVLPCTNMACQYPQYRNTCCDNLTRNNCTKWRHLGVSHEDWAERQKAHKCAKYRYYNQLPPKLGRELWRKRFKSGKNTNRQSVDYHSSIKDHFRFIWNKFENFLRNQFFYTRSKNL
jgi:hypothetical protein